MRTFNVCTAALIKCVFITNVLLAQNNDSLFIDSMKSYQLNEIIVSATRTEKEILDVPRSVSVITSEEIDNAMVNNVAELLSEKEGIYIVGTGQTPGSMQTMFVRGANSNQTVVMVDGVRLSDPSTTDNVLNLSELSLANVERIEIVRGSHSTMYGSSAIGGTVNIITKNGADKGFNLIADSRIGTFGGNTNMFAENLFLNYTFDNGLYINTGVYYSKVNGIDATLDTITTVGAYKNFDKDGFNKLDYFGKLGYQKDKLNVFASFKKTDQTTDVDGGAYNDDDNYFVEFDRNLFTYGASWQITDPFKLAYSGGYSELIRHAVNDSSVIDAAGNYDQNYYEGIFKGSFFNNELLTNYSSKGLNVVLGTGMSDEKMTFHIETYAGAWGFQSTSDMDSLNLLARQRYAFLHTDINGSLLSNKLSSLSLGLGGRINRHNVYGINYTYAINPSYKIGKRSLLYASYSTGFNAPSLYQLYSPDLQFGALTSRGNNALEPETSYSFEVGLKQSVNDNLTFTVSYFNTVVNNTIEYVYLWNKNTAVDSLGFLDYLGDTYINLSKQTNKGIEISIHSKLSDKLSFYGSFSTVNGTLSYAPGDIDVNYTDTNHVQLFNNGAFINQEVKEIGLIRRPSSIVRLGLNYRPLKQLSCGLDIKYAGATSDVAFNSTLGPYGALGKAGIAEYMLIDILAKYELFKGFTAGVKIENVLDEAYVEINGYATRGRSYYLNIIYKLNIQ